MTSPDRSPEEIASSFLRGLTLDDQTTGKELQNCIDDLTEIIKSERSKLEAVQEELKLRTFERDTWKNRHMPGVRELELEVELLEAKKENERLKNSVHFQYPDGKDNADYRKENEILKSERDQAVAIIEELKRKILGDVNLSYTEIIDKFNQALLREVALREACKKLIDKIDENEDSAHVEYENLRKLLANPSTTEIEERLKRIDKLEGAFDDLIKCQIECRTLQSQLKVAVEALEHTNNGLAFVRDAINKEPVDRLKKFIEDTMNKVKEDI